MAQDNQRQLQAQGANAMPSLPAGIDPADIPLPVRARAASIALDCMARGEIISAAQALAAAYHFQESGEVMGRHAYIGTKGSVAGRVLEGYRGVARRLDMSNYQWRYRPATEEELAEHRIQQGDRIVICELTNLTAYQKARQLGLEYQPIIGMSIARKGDTINSPKFRDTTWTLKKQARTDALRQAGENTTADEELDEAEAHGIDVNEWRDKISDPEQAQAAVDASVRAAANAARTPEQAFAEQQDNRDQLAMLDMSKKLSNWLFNCAMGEETPCPQCNVPFAVKAHTADCVFRIINPDMPLYEPVPAAPAPEETQLAALAPNALRAKLRAEALDSSEPATPRQREWTAAELALLSGDPAERARFMTWAFGPHDELTRGMAAALYMWSGATKHAVTKQIVISDQARSDFKAVIDMLNAFEDDVLPPEEPEAQDGTEH